MRIVEGSRRMSSTHQIGPETAVHILRVAATHSRLAAIEQMIGATLAIPDGDPEYVASLRVEQSKLEAVSNLRIIHLMQVETPQVLEQLGDRVAV